MESLRDRFIRIWRETDIIDKLEGKGWIVIHKEDDCFWTKNVVIEWMYIHCKNRFVYTENACAFKNNEDAVKFILTWC